MTVDPTSYGTVVGVQAYIRHMTLDAANNPTTAQIEAFIDEMSAQLNGWLAQAGYVIPVTEVKSVRILVRYAQIGAAGLAELTQRSGAYSAQAQNNRENKFLDEFYKAEAFIKSGALANLGADESEALGGFVGLATGGTTSGGQQLRPIFSRRMFGNDPTKETPAGKEPDY